MVGLASERRLRRNEERASGAEVVEQAVEPDALVVGLDAVRLVEKRLPARADVPGRAPRADRHVPPAVGDPELAEVDVAGDRRRRRRAGRSGSSSRRGRRRDPPTRARAVRARRARPRASRCACSGCRSTRRRDAVADAAPARGRSQCATRKSNGHASTGAAAWNAASPRARIGTRRAGSAMQRMAGRVDARRARRVTSQSTSRRSRCRSRRAPGGATAPIASAPPRRARWGSDRIGTTFRKWTARRDERSSSRQVVATSGHSHAIGPAATPSTRTGSVPAAGNDTSGR